LLAVSLAVNLSAKQGNAFTTALAVVFFLVSVVFVYRSFYGMRIESGKQE
jgi:K(+)-stimulated pyrophosphate-energized sodium pump